MSAPTTSPSASILLPYNNNNNNTNNTTSTTGGSASNGGRHDGPRRSSQASPRVGSPLAFINNASYASGNGSGTAYEMKGIQYDPNSKIILPPHKRDYRFTATQEKSTTTPTPKRRKKSKFPIFHFRLPKQGANKN